MFTKVCLHFLFFLFASLSAFRVFADDIAIITIPKAGSFLIKRSIELLLNTDSRMRSINEMSVHSVYLDHLWPYSMDIRKSGRWKTILLIRDPRDVLISMMYWTLKKGYVHIAIPAKNKLQAFLALSHDEKITYLILNPENALGVPYFVNEALLWMQDPDITVIRFEDLIGEKGGGSQKAQLATLQKLSLIFGLDYSEEDLIEIANKLHGNTTTFRKGMIGSWKEEFTEEHKTLFKEKMGEALIQLGYEKDLNW